MARTAILLAENLDGQLLNLAKLLDFFGVPWDLLGIDKICETHVPIEKGAYCVLADMRCAGQILAGLKTGEAVPSLLRKAESLFFFGSDFSDNAQCLVQKVTQSPTAGPKAIPELEVICSVSDYRRDICGPFSGLEVIASLSDSQFVMTGIQRSDSVVPLISVEQGIVFLASAFNGMKCFLASSVTVVDLQAPLRKPYYDVAEDFLTAVPFVMYLRYAFDETVFRPSEAAACVILDDPLLRKRYGFVDFSKVERASCDHGFSLNLAVIPWNYKRSRASVVNIFKRNTDRLSISVHGCDHSAREFATGNAEAINGKARLALARMNEHERRNGLSFDPIMVFPQGAFSSIAPGLLRQGAFIAAVNTELLPIEKDLVPDLGDAWSMAILKYGDFAIYSRRYAFHGLHNFAFDLLLGKPCLLTTHHHDFHDDNRDLIQFVHQLNGLNSHLTWRPLGELIRRAYLQRFRSDGTREVRMFGNEIYIDNDDAKNRHIAVEKLSRAGGEVDCVLVSGKSIPFWFESNRLRFDFVLSGNESVVVRIQYKDFQGNKVLRLPLQSRVKIGLRRRLSELRDETQARAPWVYSVVQGTRTGLTKSLPRAVE